MAGPSGRLSGVLADLADGGGRTGWATAPVALMTLAAPVACVACVALFALSLPRSVPEGRKWRLDAGILPHAALGLYAFYESGTSAYTSIRVDLLLSYPAHFVTLLGTFFPFFRRERRQPSGSRESWRKRAHLTQGLGILRA